jgi:hypothetical protein
MLLGAVFNNYGNGGVVMAVRVIYKDKDIGIVNESRLSDLIKSGRIVAFCRSNGEWVSVEHASAGHVDE